MCSHRRIDAYTVFTIRRYVVEESRMAKAKVMERSAHILVARLCTQLPTYAKPITTLLIDNYLIKLSNNNAV